MKRWIDIGAAALRYEITGDGPATLVLVHEMGGTLDSWDHVLPALNQGRRVLRYDTSGAGQSEKLRGTVTFNDMADDLAGLLDALAITDKVALAGCAVGAAIALHFAARSPGRVLGVVAMGPATGVAPERRAQVLALAENVRQVGMRGIVEASFAASYPPEVRHDAKHYAQFRARWLAGDPDSYAAIYSMLAHADIVSGFAAIACPVLLLAGTLDRLRPPDSVRPLADIIPGARFAALESGHFMAVQTPARVAELVTEFLAEIGA
jgi:pimeloyl-ACP methyl ester carboxylesterase